MSHEVESSHWARLEPVGAELAELGHVDRQAVTHRIWIRQAGAVAPGKRFRRGMRVFEIVTVHDPDESGRYLVCRAKEA